jgi:hypothetical protein
MCLHHKIARRNPIYRANARLNKFSVWCFPFSFPSQPRIFTFIHVVRREIYRVLCIVCRAVVFDVKMYLFIHRHFSSFFYYYHFFRSRSEWKFFFLITSFHSFIHSMCVCRAHMYTHTNNFLMLLVRVAWTIREVLTTKKTFCILRHDKEILNVNQAICAYHNLKS